MFLDSNKNYFNKVSQNLNIIGLNKPTELKILLLPVTEFYSISHESQMQGRHNIYFYVKYNENMRMVVHNNNMTLHCRPLPRDAMKIKIT